ncbi:MAG: hypothetical protein BGO30_08385 [Bacteroidetes bacterium 41-46]|nr:MAG: hypothetical protein BGO30_08385 [Bacteroidetes bacterium 41-46]
MIQESTTGRIIINENHPNTKSKYLISSTFAPTRSESIKLFIKGSGNSWKFWYRRYNFKCVRANCQISTI